MGFIPRMQGWFNIENTINAMQSYQQAIGGGGNQMIMSINGDKAFNKIQYLQQQKKSQQIRNGSKLSKLDKKTL